MATTEIIPPVASRALRVSDDVGAQLDALVAEVKVAAMTIDPTIKEVWAAHQISTVGGEVLAVSAIYFKRGLAPVKSEGRHHG